MTVAAPAPWLDALPTGRIGALARAITAVENGGDAAAAVLATLPPPAGRAAIVGITGPPGAGKSTLIGALIGALRREQRRVAVLAVDPSSPVSGGAVLGDRLRMAAHDGDDGVFVRSLAARGHLGGLARTAWSVVRLLDAAGADVVLVETVGTGQSEVEIGALAHACLVLCAPGAGDEVQAIKAGILEIADLLVVNKADQPQAGPTVAQLEAMLALRPPGARPVTVMRTVATRGDGVPELLAQALAVASRRRAAAPDGPGALRRVLADAAAQAARRAVLAAEDAAVETLCARLAAGAIGLEDAACLALRRLAAGLPDRPH